jgi:DNA polymerase III epsilon subunit family exonuclease
MDSSILIVGSACALVLLIIILLKTLGKDSSSDVSSAPGVGGSSSDGLTVDLSSVPERFIVFDLETTGLDPTRHEIIEIGAIRVQVNSEVHDSFQTLVKPLKRIPKAITRINGISQEMVDQEGEPLEIALTEFVEFIGDLPLVSYNAEFDMGFLLNATDRHNIAIKNEVSCALKMARRAWPGLKSYRLCDIAKMGNLSDEDTHRALGDCKRTILIYTAAASILHTGR